MFCELHEDDYGTWQDAWKAFWPARQQTPDVIFEKVAGPGAPQYTFITPKDGEQLALL